MSQTNQTHQGPQDYILGNGAQEQERLKFQASILERWTEQFFRSAGIERGMNVLDLGCGMGDVSLLAARLVGPAGNVTGIDRDLAIIEKARERVRHQECGANIEFGCSDLFDFEAIRCRGRALRSEFFSLSRWPLSLTQQDKCVLKESLSSTSWTLLPGFEAVQTGHWSAGCVTSWRKRNAAPVSG